MVLRNGLPEPTQTYDLHAAVVMPDHVHLLYSALRRRDRWQYSLPEIMKAIKGRSGREINLTLKRTGPVGPEGFFDHVLRSNDSLVDGVNYFCQSRVRAGLAKAGPTTPGCGKVRFQSCGAGEKHQRPAA